MAALPSRARLILLLVISLSLIALWLSLPAWDWTHLPIALLLGLVAGYSYEISPALEPTTSDPDQDAHPQLATSYHAYFAALAALVLSPIAGAVIIVLAAWLHRAGTSRIKLLYNTTQESLTAALFASVVILGCGGSPATAAPGLLIVSVAGAAIAAAAVNMVSVGAMISAAVGVPFREIVTSDSLRLNIPVAAAELSIAPLAALYWTGAQAAAIMVASSLALLAALSLTRYPQVLAARHTTLRGLTAAVEAKDAYTRGHSERVSVAATRVARRMGMPDARVSALRYAGMLHDVGKLAVPTGVLRKAGAPTDDEFAVIRSHPVLGRQLTESLDFLQDVVFGIESHHERHDGKGYPRGLSGDAIPEFARIISVVDAFDSMTTTRSYRPARSLEEAIAEIQRCSGTHFHPAVVEALASELSSNGWYVGNTVTTQPPAAEEGALPVYAVDDDDPVAVELLAGSAPDSGGHR